MPKKKTKPKTRKPAAKSKPRRKAETFTFDPAATLIAIQPLIDELANQAADIKSALANIAGLQSGLRSTVERLAKVDVLAQSQQAIVASLGTRAATWQAVESLEKKIETLTAQMANRLPIDLANEPTAPDPEPAPLHLEIQVEPQDEGTPSADDASMGGLAVDLDTATVSAGVDTLPIETETTAAIEAGTTVEPPTPTDEFDLT